MLEVQERKKVTYDYQVRDSYLTVVIVGNNRGGEPHYNERADESHAADGCSKNFARAGAHWEDIDAFRR
jgi:hypothetical protein